MLYMQLHFSMYSTLCKVNTVYIYCDAGQLGKFTSDGRYSKQGQQGLFNVFKVIEILVKVFLCMR